MNWNEILEYRNDGALIWKNRPRHHFPRHCSFTWWNNKLASKVAGRIGSIGYLVVCHRGKIYYAHRIIWEMHNGPIPKKLVIDHINQDKLDNRICNLRLATQSMNMHNSSRAAKPASGCYGVYEYKNKNRQKRFYSKIRSCGKSVRLGDFHTAEEAMRAYVSAKQIEIERRLTQ